jgi:Flp pilus assembly protein TadD
MVEDATEELVTAGLAALDEGDVETARKYLHQARERGENDVRVLHLSGMVAWAQGEMEHATGFLLQAVDGEPNRPEIYLDCAECLLDLGEIEEAEVQVRNALRLEQLGEERADEAQLLLAQIRLADDDPNGALTSLENISTGLQNHSAVLGTRGAALLMLDRAGEAIAVLEEAVADQAEDSDLRYQLAIALEAGGKLEAGREQMLKVLELDQAEAKDEGTLLEPPNSVESDAWRERLEQLISEMPAPLLELVANAPITVQGRATADQVRNGVNPRSGVCFLGTPKTEAHAAELRGIAIMRDIVAEEADTDDDDDVEAALFEALVDEIRYFFKREDLAMAEG